MKILAGLVLALALVGGALGCGGAVKAEEPDLQLIDMNIQIGELQTAAWQYISAALSGDSAALAIAKARLETFKQQNSDALENSRQLQKVLGKPKEPTPYTPENAADRRKASDTAHSAGFWAWMGGAILTTATVLIGLAKSPLVKSIPFIGTAANVADAVVQGGEQFMDKMKQQGKPEIAAALAAEMVAVQAERNLVPATKKVLGHVKKRMSKPKGAQAVRVDRRSTVPAPAAAAVPVAAPDEETKVLKPGA